MVESVSSFNDTPDPYSIPGLVANFSPLVGVGQAGTNWQDGLVNKSAKPVKGGIGTGSSYINMDGFDLVWSQSYLQTQMASIESDIINIENNANLTDSEKMFSLQMAMNSWSSCSICRTEQLKCVADTLKTIARNLD